MNTLKNESRLPNVLIDKGVDISDHEKIVNAFAEFFQSAFVDSTSFNWDD